MTDDRASLAARLRRMNELAATVPGLAKGAQPTGGGGPTGTRETIARRRENGTRNHADAGPPAPLTARGSWERLDEHVWRFRSTGPNPLHRDRPLRLLTSAVDSDGSLVFIDTETTGLSGGAGTVAFLIGFGRVDGAELIVDQYFLSDFPGERTLIELLENELSRSSVLVTFNGKSFDVPILRARFSLHGRALSYADHIDLLHPARRLWRSKLDSCSLHSLEASVLGVTRESDVAGSLVPEIYFRYLNHGDRAELAAVFDHHRQDIVSLAALLDRIETLGESASIRGVDGVELGRLMLERSFAAGLDLLLHAAHSGDFRAGRYAIAALRRQREFRQMQELLEALWSSRPSFFVGIELSKFYEHRLRDPARAQTVIERLEKIGGGRVPGGETMKRDIARRRQRLARKVMRAL